MGWRGGGGGFGAGGGTPRFGRMALLLVGVCVLAMLPSTMAAWSSASSTQVSNIQSYYRSMLFDCTSASYQGITTASFYAAGTGGGTNQRANYQLFMFFSSPTANGYTVGGSASLEVDVKTVKSGTYTVDLVSYGLRSSTSDFSDSDYYITTTSPPEAVVYGALDSTVDGTGTKTITIPSTFFTFDWPSDKYLLLSFTLNDTTVISACENFQCSGYDIIRFEFQNDLTLTVDLNVNECATSNGGCATNASCTDTSGSFTCTCNSGYEGDGFTCSEANECSTSNGGCSADATCTNTVGSFSCACNTGFTGDGVTCTDINECATSNGGCATNATCTNTPGSYSCACNTGYAGDGITTCTEINECTTSNGGCSTYATCANTAGSYSCTCNTGYDGDGFTCTDINECATSNGGCDIVSTCTNSAGSFTCGSCPTGFSGTGSTGCTATYTNTSTQVTFPSARLFSVRYTCSGSSVDSTAFYTVSTVSTGMVIGSWGSYPSTSVAQFFMVFDSPSSYGFTVAGAASLSISVDAIYNGYSSSFSANLVSYGFRSTAYTFDLLADSYLNSGFNATVTTVVSGALNSTDGTGQKTVSIPSSFFDFEWPEDQVLLMSLQLVDSNVYPIAASGSCSLFTQRFNPGTSVSLSMNLAVNECATNNGGCDVAAICTNTLTSYSCACPAVGYTGDGFNCTEINECATSNGGCSADATCTNTAGSYSCACNTGYDGDGFTCTDVNECATSNGGCDIVTTCTNSAGSFTCGSCPTDFTGTGSTGCTATYTNTSTQVTFPSARLFSVRYTCDYDTVDSTAFYTVSTVSTGMVIGTWGSYPSTSVAQFFMVFDSPSSYGFTVAGAASLSITIDQIYNSYYSSFSADLVSYGLRSTAYTFDLLADSYLNDGFSASTSTLVSAALSSNGGTGQKTITIPSSFFTFDWPEDQVLLMSLQLVDANAYSTAATGSCRTYSQRFNPGTISLSMNLAVNECATSNGGCDAAAICTNTLTSYSCACPAVGYTGNGFTCTDINECATNNGGCATNSYCINTGGSFSCGSCFDGYSGSGDTSCTDINECATNQGGCDALTTCTNSQGSFACSACPTGYNGTGLTGCTDINECATSNGGCDVLSSCTNSAGSYECGSCPSGYDGTGLTGCTDINECATSHGGCDALVTCTNSGGSFECGPCPTGYDGTGSTGCIEINECATNNGGCDILSNCTNTAGSFECGDCPSGYNGTGASGCTDVNECATSNGGCDALTTCTNSVGSFACGNCPSGYTGSGSVGCTDINECATSNGGCDVLSNCTNSPGSFECGPCPSGYSGSGNTSCVDINECATDNGGCDVLTTCTNSAGGRTCGACPSGYSGDGENGCTEINECETSNGGCDALVTCTNTVGSYECGDCPTGYTGDGAVQCTDVNECATNNGGCDRLTNCTNNLGSYECGSCPEYYVGHGSTICLAEPTIHVSFGDVTVENGANATEANGGVFGGVAIPKNVTRTFTILNTGDIAMQIADVFLSGSSNFHLSSSPALVVEGNSSTTLEIMFLPSTDSVDSAVLTIVSNSTRNSIFTFEVDGVGAVVPQVTMLPEKFVPRATGTAFTTSISVSLYDATSPTITWFKNGDAISGSTSSSFTISSVSDADSGLYSVQVQGRSGNESVISSVFFGRGTMLQVYAMPSVVSSTKTLVRLPEFGSFYTSISSSLTTTSASFNVGEFETNLNWWSGYDTSIASAVSANRTADAAHLGSYGLMLEHNSNSAAEVVFDPLFLTGSRTHSLTFWTKSANGSSIPFGVTLLSEADLSVVVGETQFTATGSWAQSTISITNTTNQGIRMRIALSCACSIYLDDVKLQFDRTHSWYNSATLLSSWTSTFVNITPVALSNQGSYRCVVANGPATVTSNSVSLIVDAFVNITAQPLPLNRTFASGDGPLTLTVGARVTSGSLAYQWRFNGAPISGASSMTYSLSAVKAANSGSFDCVLQNGVSTTTTSPVTVTVFDEAVRNVTWGGDHNHTIGFIAGEVCWTNPPAPSNVVSLTLRFGAFATDTTGAVVLPSVQTAGAGLKQCANVSDTSVPTGASMLLVFTRYANDAAETPSAVTFSDSPAPNTLAGAASFSDNDYTTGVLNGSLLIENNGESGLNYTVFWGTSQGGIVGSTAIESKSVPADGVEPVTIAISTLSVPALAKAFLVFSSNAYGSYGPLVFSFLDRYVKPAVPAEDLTLTLVGETSANLTWTSPEDGHFYDVSLFQGSQNSGSSTTFDIVALNITAKHVLLTDLANSSYYVVRVAARMNNAVRTSDAYVYPTEEVFTTETFYFDFSVPTGQVTQIVVEQASGNHLTLSWEPAPRASRYRIVDSTSSSSKKSAHQKAATVLAEVTSTSTTLTNLPTGSALVLEVIAGNTAGFAAAGTQLQVSMLTPVTNLQVAAFTERTLTLSWNASPGAELYVVDLRQVGAESFVELGNTTQLWFVADAQMSENTAYELRVRAGALGVVEEVGVTIVATPRTKLRREFLTDLFDSAESVAASFSWSAQPTTFDVGVTEPGWLFVQPSPSSYLFANDTANRLYRDWANNFDVSSTVRLVAQGGHCGEAGIAIVAPTAQPNVQTQHGRRNEFGAGAPSPECFRESVNDDLLGYPRAFLSSCFPSAGEWVVLKLHVQDDAISVAFHKRDDTTSAGLTTNFTRTPALTTASLWSQGIDLRLRREGRVFTAWVRGVGSSPWTRVGQTSQRLTGTTQVGVFAASCSSLNATADATVAAMFSSFTDATSVQENQEGTCRTQCANLPLTEMGDNVSQLYSSAKYVHACSC